MGKLRGFELTIDKLVGCGGRRYGTVLVGQTMYPAISILRPFRVLHLRAHPLSICLHIIHELTVGGGCLAFGIDKGGITGPFPLMVAF